MHYRASSSRICLFASHSAPFLRCVSSQLRSAPSAAISRAKSRQLAHLGNFSCGPTPCTFGTHRPSSSFISSEAEEKEKEASFGSLITHAQVHLMRACKEAGSILSLSASLLLLLLPFRPRKSKTSSEQQSHHSASAPLRSRIVVRCDLAARCGTARGLLGARTDGGKTVRGESRA